MYPILRHAIDLIQDKRSDVAVTHAGMQGNVSASVGQAKKKQHSCGEHHHTHTDEPQESGQRLRRSPFAMISVDDAMRLIFEQASRMAVVERPVARK